MPILVRDETANATVLTIDNNGNMAFGDGTPINMLTLNGYGIIDSEGYIVHGLGSSVVFPASGYVNVPPGGQVRIDTIPNVTPIVVADTTWPAYNYDSAYSLPPSDPDWPNSNYETQTERPYPLHYPAPQVGCFYMGNNNVVSDSRLLDPFNSQYYDDWLASGQGCNYRWI